MSLPGFAVRRPIFTSMLVLMLLILGAISLARLPIDLMPDITNPTLSISTTYGNAGPQELEELVTRPLEEALSAVPGVEEITSVSTEGQSQVRITFTWGTDMDAAANDIRDRLDRVIGRLPEEADRPTLRKFDLAAFPILILGVASDLDPIQLRELIDDEIKYRIERVPGVASLDIRGGLEREVHIEVDPDKVRALGLSLDVIAARLKAENVTVPAGTIELGSREILIRTPGEFRSLQEIRETVVAVRDGAAVRLDTIARTRDTWRKLVRSVRVDGRPGVRLSVSKQSGTNTVEVAKQVLAEIERINRDIPQVRLTTIIDTSRYIERSITNVGSSVLYGGLLAILVLLFFLRDLRSTSIIAMAIPISVIATFTLMYFNGFTLNLMTLGGLALGVGMLVDNSIVVLENIFRFLEDGAAPDVAAVEGGDEVALPILASTLTTMVVFLPLVFVRGMAGIMVQQLAWVVGFALLCSLVVALTVVPMLSAILMRRMKGAGRAAAGGAARVGWIEGALRGLEETYGEGLGWVLRHRLLTILGALSLLAGSLGLVPRIGVEMMPESDEGEVRINAEMEVGSRLEVVDRAFRQVEEIVAREVPEAAGNVALIGGAGYRAEGSHTAELRVALVDQKDRRRSSEEIAQALRGPLSQVPGMRIRTRAGQGLFILRMARGSGEKLEIDVRGHDLEVADVLAMRVLDVIEDVPGVTDGKISRDGGNPEEQVVVDRQKAASLGISLDRVARMLETAISGTRVGSYRDAGEEYPLMLKVEGADRMGLRGVLDLTLVNDRGEPVVLRNVVETVRRTGPARIERKDQQRVVTISANFSGRDQGSVIADVRKALRQIPVPQGFAVLLGGGYEEQQAAFWELMLMFALSLIFVYMVMACQYESLRHPLAVMFSVPLAVVGVLVALYLTDTTFNVQSFIGCILLGGIVVNNAILLVDHVNLLRERDGASLPEAVAEAGRRRLRPILMTASTTVLGLLPLALGIGEGGETQAPMARAVIGGLVSSTAITLFLVPVVYSFLDPERGDG